MLALETANRLSFEVVANAVEAINSYRVTRARETLETALADLRNARERDRHYLFVPYYIAVIEELLGRSHEAVEQLRVILSEAPGDRPALINELRFNLAVAQFHGYSHEWLQTASETLQRILADTNSVAGRLRYSRLRLHSRALLSRVYAMWSIPRTPEDVVAKHEQDRISNCYGHAIQNARAVVRSMALSAWRVVEAGRAREIEAVARNASGTAEMYYSDFFLDEQAKLAALRRGLKQLRKSDLLFPRDWATYCNIGSCHMRIAIWSKESSEFDVARKFLNEVVAELYPNYGFALYEIGRTHRVEGNFGTAISFFNRALQIPYEKRAVSDRRINREIGLAQEERSQYP